MYDVVVSFIDGSVEYMVRPIRYGYSDNVIAPSPSDSLNMFMTATNTVFVLAAGTYKGNLETGD